MSTRVNCRPCDVVLLGCVAAALFARRVPATEREFSARGVLLSGAKNKPAVFPERGTGRHSGGSSPPCPNHLSTRRNCSLAVLDFGGCSSRRVLEVEGGQQLSTRDPRCRRPDRRGTGRPQERDQGPRGTPGDTAARERKRHRCVKTNARELRRSARCHSSRPRPRPRPVHLRRAVAATTPASPSLADREEMGPVVCIRRVHPTRGPLRVSRSASVQWTHDRCRLDHRSARTSSPEETRRSKVMARPGAP